MNKNQPPANVFAGLVDLARLRITGMVLVSCAIGYVLSYRGEFSVHLFTMALVGTALLSAGACTLNCYLEREQDALMPRTCNRPIPTGVVSPHLALAYGIALILAGSYALFVQVNLLAGSLGLSALFVYLALYTPAKRVTWLNTSIGAVPGAIPPMIGWAAATGSLDFGAWVLFVMLVIWQHTHFFPIAWLYKSDYAAAGFQMLPVMESSGKKTFLLTLLTAIALLPVSMLLCESNLTGLAYIFGASLGGVLLIGASFQWLRQPDRPGARAVLLLSLFYLPVILAAVMIDRYGAFFGSHFYQWIGAIWRWT